MIGPCRASDWGYGAMFWCLIRFYGASQTGNMMGVAALWEKK